MTMTKAARREAEHFVGQVIERLTDRSLNIWALVSGGSYIAYGVNADEWPIGSVVQCYLAEGGNYIDRVESVDEATLATYKDFIAT